jgi:hypothetical protein
MKRLLAIWFVLGAATPALAQETDTDTDGDAAEGTESETPDVGETEPEELPEQIYPGQQIPSDQARIAAGATETDCTNAADDDGDSMADCADADCFEHPTCEPGRGSEQTNEACSDWIDNDADARVDCDDTDCQAPTLGVCQGSDRTGTPVRGSHNRRDDVTLASGASVEALIGTDGDRPGERTDLVCSDGRDNDNDGRVDCEDYECRFSSDVTICTGAPGLTFSVVAAVRGSMDLELLTDDDPLTTSGQAFDVNWSRIQLRAFGPIPFLDDSFFLLSARLERSPRLTFAMFQIPVGNAGHYFNFNSGGGNLSTQLIVSAHKHALLDPAFYVFNAFEQGNSAAIEFGGPLTDNGVLEFRLFAAGGQGTSTGNVGGRFFSGDNRNFSYAGGGQLHINAIGNFDRFESEFIYTPEPLTLGFLAGVMWSQRPVERFLAFHGQGLFRWSHFMLRAESYTKREVEFGAWQTSWNVLLGALIVPEYLYFAADVGMFYAGNFDELPPSDSDLTRPPDVFEYRLGLHYYWFRQRGRIALVYRENHEENTDPLGDELVERQLLVEALYRF